jgi:Na+-transporting methylmalonyl-CoA/oxaloacetate decarboxylase gamma subunit
MPNGNDDGSGTTTTTAATLTRAGTAAAFLALFGLALFVVFMITAIGKPETEWTRLAWLFTGVETLAFAGAGALFGTTVQRARVEEAEKKAQKNERDAENGRKLATVIKADAPGSPTGKPALEAMGATPGTPGDAIADRHAKLAEDMFPS